jgi:hypothetical protein
MLILAIRGSKLHNSHSNVTSTVELRRVLIYCAVRRKSCGHDNISVVVMPAHHDSNFPCANFSSVAHIATPRVPCDHRHQLIISNHTDTHLAWHSQRLNFERLDEAEPWPLRRHMQVQRGSRRVLDIASLFGTMTIGRPIPSGTICRPGGQLAGGCFLLCARLKSVVLPRSTNVIKLPAQYLASRLCTT